MVGLKYAQEISDLIRSPIVMADYSIDNFPEDVKTDWELKKIHILYFTFYNQHNEWVFTPLSLRNKNKKFYYVITDNTNNKILRIYDITPLVETFVYRLSRALGKELTSTSTLSVLNEFMSSDDNTISFTL